MQEVFKEAIAKWGESLQIDMVQEECAELIAAINRFKRGRATMADVVQEMADVQIMLWQAQEIFVAPPLGEAIKGKVERLRQRIATTTLIDECNRGE